jgi:hypothetical protein
MGLGFTAVSWEIRMPAPSARITVFICVLIPQLIGEGDKIRGRVSRALDLSILIVNFNGGEMLRKPLASIETTRGDLTVQTIVVDNASADGSADVVGEFPGVILLRNRENAGFARGNNQAARMAAGSLILLLNNDTVLRPNAM